MGEYWDELPEAHRVFFRLSESDIALVLVSQAFLNSHYCQKVEVQSFLRQRRSRGMVIFPIIMTSVEHLTCAT